MTIYLVRHGQTEWNTKGLWQGNTDIPLDETGVNQSKALARRLKNVHAARIYTSPLLRAAMTAEIISEANGAPVTLNDGLREIRFGTWEGKTYKDISLMDGYKGWEDDFDAAPHGGESFYQAYARFLSAINYIIQAEDSDTIIVSHGGVLRLFYCYVLNMRLEDRLRLSIGNTSLTTIQYDKVSASYKMITLNDISHTQLYS